MVISDSSSVTTGGQQAPGLTNSKDGAPVLSEAVGRMIVPVGSDKYSG
jgi:hypothetical protein